MASFMASGDIDWLWGSLKPWQILHSALAERGRNGSAADVWEVVNETLVANTAASSIPAREQEERDHNDKGSSSSSSWAQGLRFLGDDGEFWKPGGVMESRVREWLSRRDEDELAYRTSTRSELAIAACSNAPARALQRHCEGNPSLATQLQLRLGADYRRGYGDADADGEASSEGRSENAEDDEEEESAQIFGYDDHDAGGAELERDFGDNYTVISCNHEDYEVISNVGDQCKFYMNPCCTRAAPPVAADHDDDHGAAAKMAVGLHLAEEVEVCAVCLEKLLNDDDDEEEEEVEEEVVQVLACRHLFHRGCISPWLERQPHARCPCCRAPILDPPQLHLAASLHVEAASNPPSTSCGPRQQVLGRRSSGPQHDIMGLLADMEAALERLGFRS